MNKKAKIIVLGIIGVILMACSYIFQVNFNLDFKMSMIPLCVFAVVFMIIVNKYEIENMSETFYKNRMSYIYIEFTKIVLLTGVTTENRYGTILSKNAFLVVTILCIIVFIVDMALFLKKPDNKNFINYMLGTFLFLYFYTMSIVRMYWILFIAIPIFIVQALYNDRKGLKINYIFVMVNSSIISWRLLYFIYKMDPYYVGVFAVTVLFIAAFGIAVMRTTKINEMSSEKKIAVINEKKEETLKIANQVLDMGKKIKDNSDFINNNVNTISTTTNNAIIILEDIKTGNEKNIRNINHQSEMTKNIIKLTKDVKKAMDKVILSIRAAYVGLEKSIASMEDLKGKSDLIMKSNEEVIRVIGDFAENISKMNNTVSEISAISEQTNLLSLNASIESARAGEKGKGFSVVASEIASLSEETEDLTRHVGKMVYELQESVNLANSYLKGVISSVESEDESIDKNIENISKIKSGIMNLEGTIRGVLKGVGKVVDVSGKIEEHSVAMDDLSKKITEEVGEVVTLNEINCDNASKTKELLDELNIVAENLNQCIY